MEFCPKCGALLVQKKKHDGCPRCSYNSKNKIKLKVTEKVGSNFRNQEIGVMKKKTDVLPIITEKCKKCGNEKVFFWTVQTRAGDEAETKFFKCTKCSFTWREYR